MMTRLAALAALAACGSDPAPPPDNQTVYGDEDRPVTLQIPGLIEGQTYPLVLILHGYGASGFVQQAYFGLDDLVDRETFVLAPDGTVDSNNRQFWNADDVCCDFDNKNPDDVAYLGALLDDVMADWPIDPARVRVIGHSNGGYMAYRLACERADVVTSIVGLAGNMISLPCAPARPVHVLHIHGTQDQTVPFSGAAPSRDTWADLNGCTGAPASAASLNLDSAVDGEETRVFQTEGCPETGAVELWEMVGSGHIPSLLSTFDNAVDAFWQAHPRR